MLLPQHHHHFSLPPKTQTIPFLSSLPNKIPISQKLKGSTFTKKFLVRSCSDSEIAPKSAIERIAEKLRSLGYTEALDSKPNPESNSAGKIFVPLPHQLPKYRVGHTIDTSWSTPENPVYEPGSNSGKEKKKIARGEEEKVPTLAELNLPKKELKRLRLLGIGLQSKLKIGKAGITEGIVNGIHERWRSSEVVKVECEDVWKMNMKRTHDLLERKTGGLVVWRSGSKIALYRGDNYMYPYFSAEDVSASNKDNGNVSEGESCVSDIDGAKHSSPGPTIELARATLIRGVGSPNRVRFQLPGEAELVEEADRLLDGLGPRFSDWWGYEPLPVDGDLLPAVVAGYRRPFRLLPYGVKPILTNDEMNTLKRLGQPLPWHFVLGRNRKLQGLAASIVKLWEKCEIAKIAVKRGVENADSEMMAEELKYLTGGSLLSRDKDSIVLYRGKDFLPSVVSSSIEVQRKHVIEGKKPNAEAEDCSILNESHSGKEEGEFSLEKSSILEEPEHLRSAEAAMKQKSIESSTELEMKEQTELSLISKTVKEGITAEERQMLRRLGLKMKAFLLLGRRSVFAGTIENMHLHWKYRELVKIVSKETNIEAAHQVARTLETESGGILVAVEKISKGYAIIVYRGKNYQRPAALRPKTLLSKREALKRSIEEQRSKSLNLHVLEFNKNIDDGPEHQTPLENAGSECEASTTSSELNDTIAAEITSNPPTKQDGRELLFPNVGIEDRKAEPESSSKSTSKATSTNELKRFRPAVIDASLIPDNFPQEGSVSPSKFAKSKPDTSIFPVNNTLKTAPGLPCLSNKDRLLLRKQALQMKDRPNLAVGKSNIVTGVAKSIKEHFKKHPLAIVSIKGRAKGTSVQDLVRKLQEATNSVFISQEPNKVILYRGWGEGDELAKNNAGNRPRVSPELIAAIKLECGLVSNDQQKEQS